MSKNSYSDPTCYRNAHTPQQSQDVSRVLQHSGDALMRDDEPLIVQDRPTHKILTECYSAQLFMLSDISHTCDCNLQLQSQENGLF